MFTSLSAGKLLCADAEDHSAQQTNASHLPRSWNRGTHMDICHGRMNSQHMVCSIHWAVSCTAWYVQHQAHQRCPSMLHTNHTIPCLQRLAIYCYTKTTVATDCQTFPIPSLSVQIPLANPPGLPTFHVREIFIIWYSANLLAVLRSESMQNQTHPQGWSCELSSFGITKYTGPCLMQWWFIMTSVIA